MLGFAPAHGRPNWNADRTMRVARQVAEMRKQRKASRIAATKIPLKQGVIYSQLMRASVIERGAPGRRVSVGPSNRIRTKWLRHLHTVFFVTRNLAATSLFMAPSADASTMRATPRPAPSSDKAPTPSVARLRPRSTPVWPSVLPSSLPSLSNSTVRETRELPYISMNF